MDKPKPPAKVNNYKVNKPTICKSRNIQPVIYVKPREVEEVKQVVNAKVADEKLIHKPVKKAKFTPPVINSGGKNGRKENTKASSKRGPKLPDEKSQRGGPSRRGGSV